MSCTTVLQGTATWLQFVATDTGTGNPRTGIIFSEIDVSYKKSVDSAFSVKSLTGPDFREIGLGVYEILFSSAELNTLGSFIYVINNNGSLALPAIKQYVGNAFIQSAAAYTPGTIALPTNVLTGNLINLVGAALSGEAVSARVISGPSIIGNVPNLGGVGTGQVSAITDAGGFFALEILQGSVVDITIPVINYRRTLTVPANGTDVLFDIP
jgi:hypothetical protein